MNSNYGMDTLAITSHHDAEDGAPSAGIKDGELQLQTQKIIKKLNHFMVDKRYALNLDEVV